MLNFVVAFTIAVHTFETPRQKWCWENPEQCKAEYVCRSPEDCENVRRNGVCVYEDGSVGGCLDADVKK
ncbi:hypothetical protein ACKFKF_29685 [Phormidesmis sp. 146-12]